MLSKEAANTNFIVFGLFNQESKSESTIIEANILSNITLVTTDTVQMFYMSPKRNKFSITIFNIVNLFTTIKYKHKNFIN